MVDSADHYHASMPVILEAKVLAFSCKIEFDIGIALDSHENRIFLRLKRWFARLEFEVDLVVEVGLVLEDGFGDLWNPHTSDVDQTVWGRPDLR